MFAAQFNINIKKMEYETSNKQINQQHIIIIKSNNNQTNSLTIKLKKIMTKIKSLFAISTIVVLIASCTKDGETGPQGQAGSNGTNGTNGNANVTSYIIGMTNPSWINGIGNWFYYVDTSHPVQDADHSAFMVYVKVSGLWTSLPCTDVLFGGDKFRFEYNSGGIEFDYDYLSRPINTTYFKVVVIPPARLAGHPNINLNNYAEVKAAYDLKD